MSKRWWEQDRLDVEGMRTAAREAGRTEGVRTGLRQRQTKSVGG